MWDLTEELWKVGFPLRTVCHQNQHNFHNNEVVPLKKKKQAGSSFSHFCNNSMQSGSNEVKYDAVNNIKYNHWRHNIFFEHLSLLVGMVRALSLVLDSYKYPEDMCWARKNSW